MKVTNSKELENLFNKYSDKNGSLTNANFFMICKNLSLYPKIVSYEKWKQVITKDESIWPTDEDNKNDSNKTAFTFSEFVKALELMGQPDMSDVGKNSVHNMNSKAKFFAKLHNAIERYYF